MCLCLAVLGHHCCSWAFSRFSEWGATVAPGSWASHEWELLLLWRSFSCPVACGMVPDQGSNPRLPHWQVDAYPLQHQGSSRNSIKKKKSWFTWIIFPVSCFSSTDWNGSSSNPCSNYHCGQKAHLRNSILKRYLFFHGRCGIIHNNQATEPT